MTRIILLAVCLGVSSAAQAQTTTYQNIGNGMIVGSDGSMAQQLGNGVIITQPPQFNGQFGQATLPPRQTFCQPLAGGVVVCN